MKTKFTVDIAHFGREIAADWEAGRPDFRRERRVARQAMQRGLTNRIGLNRDKDTGFGRLAHVGRVLGLEPRHMSFGSPNDMEEAARWAGWCRDVVAGGAKVATGPNGGISSHSRGIWALRIETARTFDFRAPRLLAALSTARAEYIRLGMHKDEQTRLLSEWQWNRIVRPSRRRTLRNVRKIYVAEMKRRVDEMVTGNPGTDVRGRPNSLTLSRHQR